MRPRGHAWLLFGLETLYAFVTIEDGVIKHKCRTLAPRSLTVLTETTSYVACHAVYGTVFLVTRSLVSFR